MLHKARNEIVENKSKMEEDIALEVEYFLESDIPEDEFQTKRKICPSNRNISKFCRPKKKKIKNLWNETQTQVILETQVLGDIPVILEPQTDVIVIDE